VSIDHRNVISWKYNKFDHKCIKWILRSPNTSYLGRHHYVFQTC